MVVKISEIIKIAARNLRKNETEVEKILWQELKWRKLKNKKFLRQFPIYVYTEDYWLDRFIIPDFVCKENKLIIELDWSVHNLKETYELDKYKEFLLKKNWYKIIRFKNEEIKNNLQNVLEKIAALLS